jgi:hypothetical protein
MICQCSNFSKSLVTFSDVAERCNHYMAIKPSLEAIADDLRAWRSVLRCKVCGTLWTCEYPFGEGQGGGSPCLYQISTSNPAYWLATQPDLSSELRSEHEDRCWFASLSEEIGPELCCHAGCTHKRIKFSFMCRLHHFEMIRGKPYLNATKAAS